MIILVCNDDGIARRASRSSRVRSIPRGGLRRGPRPGAECGRPLADLAPPVARRGIAPRQFAIDGTPTDCVNLAVSGILPGRPGLVVSGINKGANLGDDITYSGTVSAAMEGTLSGSRRSRCRLPGVRNSISRRRRSFAARLVARVLAGGLPSRHAPERQRPGSRA
jgi:5'-nucleotidase